MRRPGPHGVTLLELLVAIVVMGITFGIVALSLANQQHAVPIRSTAATVRALRTKAVNSGMPATTVLTDSVGAELVTAYPDGRVIGIIPALDKLGGAVEVNHER